MESKVSIVITTSAIPSNPSTKLIDVLLKSMVENLDMGQRSVQIPLYILCDGYSYSEIVMGSKNGDLDGKAQKQKQPKKQSFKKSRITLEQAKNYKQFIKNLRGKYTKRKSTSLGTREEDANPQEASVDPSTEGNLSIAEDLNTLSIKKLFRIEIVELGAGEEGRAPDDAPLNLGFANAVRYAVEKIVKTPLVMVAQHDYLLVQQFPFQKVVDLMVSSAKNMESQSPADYHSHELVEYVGFDSLTTTDYIYKVKRDPTKDLEARILNGLELLPLYTWYDKTHIASTEAYKRLFAISDQNFENEKNEKRNRLKRGNTISNVVVENLASNTEAVLTDTSGKNVLADAEVVVDLIVETSDPADRAEKVSSIQEIDPKWEQLKFPLGSFIEDVFFNERIESFPHFKTYILQQHIGPVVYHLSGRKLVERDESTAPSQVVGIDGTVHGSEASVVDGNADGRTDEKPIKLREVDPSSKLDLSMYSVSESTEEGVRHPYYYKSAEIGAKFSMFEQMPSLNKNKAFTGTCYRCNQKGHSARNCPLISGMKGA